MAQERFANVDCIPYELIERIQRKVRTAYTGVQDDPAQVCTINVRFVIQKAERGSDIDGTYTITQKFADREASEMGSIRDGQLVLPGTEIRSDDPPSPEWVSNMVGTPKLTKVG